MSVFLYTDSILNPVSSNILKAETKEFPLMPEV